MCVYEDKSDRLQSVVHFNTTDVSTDVHTPYWFHHFKCFAFTIFFVHVHVNG